MMAVIAVQGDQLNFMIEGCDLATAAQMMDAAAKAIRDKLANEKPAPAASRLYLPNGQVPPLPPMPLP
jgi:hypothetical protein